MLYFLDPILSSVRSGSSVCDIIKVASFVSEAHLAHERRSLRMSVSLVTNWLSVIVAKCG